MRAFLFYLFLPIIFGIGLRRPFWSLVVYLAANIIRPDALFWGQDTGMILFKVSAAATLLGFVMSKESKSEPLTVPEWWLTLWICLAMTASVLLADLPSNNPRVWDYLGDFYRLQIVCWLIIGVLRKKQQALQLFDILLLMATLLALWGWQQHFGGNPRLDGLGGLGETNTIGAFGTLFLPLAVHKLFTGVKWWQKIFGLSGTVLIAGMIVFTNSRGAFLGLAAGCLYLLLVSPKRVRLGILYFSVLLAVVPLLSEDYIARLNTIDNNDLEQEYSAGSRQVLWQAGRLIFQDHPVFGVGLLNFAKAKAPYRYRPQFKEINIDLLNYSFTDAKVGHSTWFGQVLPEGGLFLAIPCSWLILGFFWKVRKLQWTRLPTEETRPLHNTLIGLEAGILGYCVSISFIDGLLLPFLTLMIILGVQIVRIIDEDKPMPT